MNTILKLLSVYISTQIYLFPLYNTTATEHLYQYLVPSSPALSASTLWQPLACTLYLRICFFYVMLLEWLHFKFHTSSDTTGTCLSLSDLFVPAWLSIIRAVLPAWLSFLSLLSKRFCCICLAHLYPFILTDTQVASLS